MYNCIIVYNLNIIVYFRFSTLVTKLQMFVSIVIYVEIRALVASIKIQFVFHWLRCPTIKLYVTLHLHFFLDDYNI